MLLSVTSPDDLDAEAVQAIGYARLRVECTEPLLQAVDDGREAVFAALTRAGAVYAVTTGAGARADTPVAATDADAHQARLLLARAVGSAPWLPEAEARMLLAVRLRGFLTARCGVSAALCRALTERLNAGIIPAVPRTGIGTAGEVIPLAHAFQTLLGVGRVLAQAPARPTGEGTVDAAGAMRARAVAAYVPGAKEGIALLSGAPGAVAVAMARLRSGRRLAHLLLLGAAADIDAMRAPLDPYAPGVAMMTGDPLAVDITRRLRELLDGGDPARMDHQAPVSYRVVVPVQTHLERSLARLTEDINRSLAAVTDSPTLIDGHFHSTGGFHDLALSAGLDALAMALTHAAEVAAQRMHRLLDGRFSGLPDQLTTTVGPGTGLVVVHKRAVGAVHELRRLAAPSSVGLADTSLGQEDAQTFTFEGAERLRRVEELVTEIVCCELLCARQAWALRGACTLREGAGDRRQWAAGLDEAAGALAGAVPPVLEDRPLGADLDRVRAVVEHLAPPDPRM